MQSFDNFKEKIEEFKSKDFTSIKLGFAFGLIMESYYLIEHHPELTGVKTELSHSLFSKDDIKDKLPLILKTQNAEDDEGQSELDYKTPGIEALRYMLERALEFSRPDYCIFFIIGLIRGSLNANEIDELQFQTLFSFLPSNFLILYGHDIEEMCNYFDDAKVRIEFNNDEIHLINKTS